jgi:hypothetical protein
VSAPVSTVSNQGVRQPAYQSAGNVEVGLWVSPACAAGRCAALSVWPAVLWPAVHCRVVVVSGMIASSVDKGDVKLE